VADRWDKTSKGIDVRQRIATEDLTQHTGSEESLDIALKWLQNCLVFHGVCNTNHEKSFRPSRLLYLADHSVRIHTTVEMPNKLQYLTLSHCWGKHQLVRLLESNLSSFSEDVPYELLPPTFRDAIRITRRLGFLYLWIDSLCIIQDSPEDWNHEARLMGKIYTNATCNIAASDAPDSSHGCLYPRNPRTIQPEAVTHEGEVEKIMFNKTDIYSSLHTLYTRAWVSNQRVSQITPTILPNPTKRSSKKHSSPGVPSTAVVPNSSIAAPSCAAPKSFPSASPQTSTTTTTQLPCSKPSPPTTTKSS
jgi:hypothetical protein